MKYLKILLILFSLSSTLIGLEVKNVTGPLNPDQGLIKPVFSPDGQYISASLFQYSGIRFYNLKTEKWEAEMKKEGAGFDYKWSPDSRKILFRENVWRNKRRYFKIGLYDITDKTVMYLLNEERRNISSPIWLSAAETGFFEDEELNRIKLPEKLEKPSQPITSATAYQGGIYVTKPEQVLISLKKKDERYLSPVLSSNRKKILFKIVGGPLKMLNIENYGEKEIGPFEMPFWSPDDQSILLVKSQDDGHKYTKSELHLYQPDTGTAEIIAGLEEYLPGNPSWSPDGKLIVFENLSDGKIYLIEVEQEK